MEEHLLAIMRDTLKAATETEYGRPWAGENLPTDYFHAVVHYCHTRHSYPDSLIKHAGDLGPQLECLEKLVSGCQYYARRAVFTTGLTEIALNLAGLAPATVGTPGFTLHPANASVVPYMLQPPWLRINQRETIKDRENSCCPGHCMEPSCIQYCFNAMVDFVDRVRHPYASLGQDQVNENLESGGAGRPDDFLYLGGLAPAYMTATLMLKRLVGPLTTFTHAITILAGFCSCPSTLEEQAKLPKLPYSQHSPEGATAWGIAYPAKEVAVKALIFEPYGAPNWGRRS